MKLAALDMSHRQECLSKMGDLKRHVKELEKQVAPRHFSHFFLPFFLSLFFVVFFSFGHWLSLTFFFFTSFTGFLSEFFVTSQ